MDYQALKTELLAGHPTTGAYDADDQIAANQLNTINRDAPPDSGAMLQYLLLERFRQGSLYGRIKMVADTQMATYGNGGVHKIPPVPLGVADAEITPNSEQIASANSLLRMVDTDTGFAVSLLDSRIDTILDDLALGGGVEAMGGSDKTALQALSQNQQSRANELGLGRVHDTHVTKARSI